MQVPLRVLQAVRPSVQPALLVGIASSTAVFISTPFLLPAVAEEYAVTVGAAGWISTAQLAGFVLSSWFAGRFLRPVRSVFVAIGVIGIVANLASAVAPDLLALSGARFASGLSLGLAAWFAWQDAFGDAGKTGDVAVVGPLVGVFAAPVVSALLESIGLTGTFVALAVVAGSPLLFVGQVDKADRLRPHRTRHAATPAARWILLALCLVTTGGASVFVFAAAIGTDLDGLSPLAVSIAFSGNALASIPAAKWQGDRGPAGLWFLATAVLAVTIPITRDAVVFTIALVVWGFVFFMGTPAAFGLLASRSNFPEERAGDAQAVMALGRVFAPLIGGYFLAAGQTTAMGLVAGAIIVTAGVILLAVELGPGRVDRRAERVLDDARPAGVTASD